jgi:sulfite reductase alpha subunit-like flavoprotein
MVELGADKMLELGLGDDSEEEGMEGGLHDWLEGVWPSLELEPPTEVPHIVPLKALFSERAVIRPEDDQRVLDQYFHSDELKAVSAPIISNDLMCRPDYNRDFRSIHLTKPTELDYELGDALEIFPSNDRDRVSEFLQNYSPDVGEHTVVKLHALAMDGDISLGALCTHVLDLFGKPSEHFLQQLATFEPDEEERKTQRWIPIS